MLEGKTIKKALKEIEKIEGNRFYQVLIAQRLIVERSTFKANKKLQEFNKDLKRIYHIFKIEYYVFANNRDIESNKIVIDSKIEKGEHSFFNFERATANGYHNIYYLFIDKVEKNNIFSKIKQKVDKIDIEYKENELTPKQRRIIL